LEEKMKNRVYVTEPLPLAGLELLGDIAEVIVNEKISEVRAEDIKDVDAIIAGDSKITANSLKLTERLKVIGRFGAGVDSVDIKACTEKGIILFNVPRINAESVVEHVIGMMVALSKNFRSLDKLVRDGFWSKKSKMIGNEIWKKTLGIIGAGNVGSLLARRVKVFDMGVLICDPFISEAKAKELGVELVDLETLLRESDYISINCPLTDKTKGMIGEKELKSMKNTAFIINTARGGIIKEDALYKALKEGWIKGAGIDVLENEPVTEHPLFELDNVLLTPHFASWTAEAFQRVAMKTCQNIRKALRGGVPDNVVNKEVLKS